MTVPVVVREVHPQFPPEAVEKAAAGNLVVVITVNVDGTVGDVVVKKPLSPAFDTEATKAAKQWRFRPGTKGGVPVPVQTELEFRFAVR